MQITVITQISTAFEGNLISAAALIRVITVIGHLYKSLLHLGQIVITFRTLLHLGQNVITFRTLL